MTTRDFKRSNDEDGKKSTRTSKKKTIGFTEAKQQLRTCITLFCTFLCPFLHDYDVKMPNLAFYAGDVNKQLGYLISLSVLGYGP